MTPQQCGPSASRLHFLTRVQHKGKRQVTEERTETLRPVSESLANVSDLED
jgi:hypothetical protein